MAGPLFFELQKGVFGYCYSFFVVHVRRGRLVSSIVALAPFICWLIRIAASDSISR